MYKKVVVIYVLLAILLIVLPINGKDSRVNHTYILTIRLDHIFHTMLFAPWMFFYQPVKQIPWFKNMNKLKWCLMGFAFAIATELFQYMIPYRSFSVKDLVSNCSGIFLSIVIFIFFGPKEAQSETTDR